MIYNVQIVKSPEQQMDDLAKDSHYAKEVQEIESSNKSDAEKYRLLQALVLIREYKKEAK